MMMSLVCSTCFLALIVLLTPSHAQNGNIIYPPEDETSFAEQVAWFTDGPPRDILQKASVTIKTHQFGIHLINLRCAGPDVKLHIYWISLTPLGASEPVQKVEYKPKTVASRQIVFIPLSSNITLQPNSEYRIDIETKRPIVWHIFKTAILSTEHFDLELFNNGAEYLNPFNSIAYSVVVIRNLYIDVEYFAACTYKTLQKHDNKQLSFSIITQDIGVELMAVQCISYFIGVSTFTVAIQHENEPDPMISVHYPVKNTNSNGQSFSIQISESDRRVKLLPESKYTVTISNDKEMYVVVVNGVLIENHFSLSLIKFGSDALSPMSLLAYKVYKP